MSIEITVCEHLVILGCQKSELEEKLRPDHRPQWMQGILRRLKVIRQISENANNGSCRARSAPMGRGHQVDNRAPAIALLVISAYPAAVGYKWCCPGRNTKRSAPVPPDRPKWLFMLLWETA